MAAFTTISQRIFRHLARKAGPTRREARSSHSPIAIEQVHALSQRLTLAGTLGGGAVVAAYAVGPVPRSRRRA